MFNPGWYPSVSYTLGLPGWSVDAASRFNLVWVQLRHLLSFAFNLNVWWIVFPLFLLCLANCFLLKKSDSASIGPERFFFLAMLVITLLPVFMTSQTRYSMIALIPIFYFITEGFWKFTGNGSVMVFLQKVLPAAVLIASIPTALHWMKKHPHLSLTNEIEVENNRTADFLANLGPGGVMAQYGYPPELAYLTDRRVVGMPPTPQELDRILKIFNIRYIVFGDHYWTPVKRKRGVICIDTINYIIDNPSKFRLVAQVDEKYRSKPEWPDTVRIYEVLVDRTWIYSPTLPTKPPTGQVIRSSISDRTYFVLSPTTTLRKI